MNTIVTLSAKDVRIEGITVRIYSDNTFHLKGTKVFSVIDLDIEENIEECIAKLIRSVRGQK